MIQTFHDYRRLKRQGLLDAWEISGMPSLGDRLVGLLCWIVGALAVFFLLSDAANAAPAEPGAKEASRFVLVAVYLPKGRVGRPEMRTEQFEDKALCHSIAKRYVDQIKVGQGRAFCLKVAA